MVLLDSFRCDNEIFPKVCLGLSDSSKERMALLYLDGWVGLTCVRGKRAVAKRTRRGNPFNFYKPAEPVADGASRLGSTAKGLRSDKGNTYW